MNVQKEKCYIRSIRSAQSKNSMVYLCKDTYSRIKELSSNTGKSVTTLTEELLQFALERVEIIYPDTIEQ